MTNTRTLTVTTTHASQKVARRSPNQMPTRSLSTKSRSRSGLTKTSRQNDNRMDPRHHVKTQDYHSSHGAGPVEQASAGSFERQTRRKSSSGSSTNPTGSFGSGGESNHSVPFTQWIGPTRARSAMRKQSISSDLSHDSNFERIARSLPGSFPKAPQRRPRPRITIAQPFTDFSVSNRRRPIHSTEDRTKASLVHPQALRSGITSDTVRSSLPTGLRKNSFSPKIVRLSPGSLRKARLAILDKKRSPSSSSFVPQLDNDRHGSVLLPRQHYCEPEIRGHYNAPDRQNLIVENDTEQKNSPDPNSPDGGNGSASPGHNRRSRSQKSHFRIANMRIADILRLREKEAYIVEIIETSRLRKLPLDDATKVSIEKIVRRKHGSTLVGVGPWVEVVSCGVENVWKDWCCLSTSRLVDLEDNGTLPAWTNGVLSHGEQNGEQWSDDIILVPLTDAQVRLLDRALEGSNPSS